MLHCRGALSRYLPKPSRNRQRVRLPYSRTIYPQHLRPFVPIPHAPGEFRYASEDVPSRLLLRVVTVPALALAITIAIVWQLQPVPALLRAIPAALLMLCVARPASGLMALAGLGPVAGPIAELAGESALHPPFLEQLMLASIAGIGLRLWRDRQPSRAAPWATLLATLAAASAMATLPELLLRAEPGTTMREHLVAFAGGAYFTRGPLWQPLHAAALMIEGLAVAVAGERVLRRHPGATTHVLWMFLAGVAAVALLKLRRGRATCCPRCRPSACSSASAGSMTSMPPERCS